MQINIANRFAFYTMATLAFNELNAPLIMIKTQIFDRLCQKELFILEKACKQKVFTLVLIMHIFYGLFEEITPWERRR